MALGGTIACFTSSSITIEEARGSSCASYGMKIRQSGPTVALTSSVLNAIQDIHSNSKSSVTLSTSPCRAICTVCGSSSRHE
jgi:hypothetical protein